MASNGKKRTAAELGRWWVARTADEIAEALMVHEECCCAREGALALLTLAEITETQFFINWVAGSYDGS